MKTNKSDYSDAEDIAEAVQRLAMRFADFAQGLIGIARPLYVSDPIGVEREQSLCALWARFRKGKAAVKMLLDLHRNIPTFISVADGVIILDEILPEAGAFYVMDRGYVVFERLFVFTPEPGLLRSYAVSPTSNSNTAAPIPWTRRLASDRIALWFWPPQPPAVSPSPHAV